MCGWGIAPSEFWGMTLAEWWRIHDAKNGKSVMTESDLAELYGLIE